MSLARARTQIVQSGGKNTSLETTKSPQIAFILLVDWILIEKTLSLS